jgi:pimeloyl-ACP methyl ester carboxylesterase
VEADTHVVASPLAPAVSPVRIHYREFGAGAPLLFLHGGWGYGIYPFDRQIAALSATRRIVIPDRTGYGGSGRIERQEVDFHLRAAGETFAVMDALGVVRPVIWGHSDGAVIALLMGLAAPERLGGLIVEATHVFRHKPASRAFFEMMRDNPDDLGDRVTSVLAREHGDGWRHLISTNGDAWLRIDGARAAGGVGSPGPRGASAGAAPDLYDGRLDSLRVRVLVIHGARDPRTEPGELDALRAALETSREGTGHLRQAAGGADGVPPPQFEILSDGGHSPHSERATAGEVTRLAARFLSS